MYQNFEWPIPPFYELPEGMEFAGHEPAFIILNKGAKLQGSLSRFLPTHGVVEFLPARARTNLDVPLADIKQLRLTRPLKLNPRPLRLENQTAVPSGPPLKQPFRVEFKDGEVLEGETMGFELISAGLFLYVANYADTVLRTFIPAGVIKDRRIGKLLGEALVDAKLVSAAEISSALERQNAKRTQKLGALLGEQKIVTEVQLHAALEHQRSMPIKRIGEALIEAHAISEEQLAQALEHQKQNRKQPLGEILVELGHINRGDLQKALSQKLGVPWVDLAHFRIDPEALKMVPGQLAREHRVMPLCRDRQALVVAMENPLNPEPIERVRFVTRVPVIPVMASSEAIDRALREYFGGERTDHKIEDLVTALSTEVLDGSANEEAIEESDSTLVRLVNKTILDAHAEGASDIHIETNRGRRNIRIRFRKDGVLHAYQELPAVFRRAIISRLKVMAGLDISERRRAQDGRINFAQFGPAQLELRVAIVPTLDGLEDVVLRLLAGGEPLPIAKLGLSDTVLEQMHALLAQPHGLILVCGPTGSGKTTTLHSLLGLLNSPDRKIWTAEDPVEISQVGMRQVQVNSRIGWTFAAAMRSFLRADPDVIMVGEMRDAETAAIAIEGSLTGHLVLSTLHTNSAPETVTRLLELGMDPFNFADSLAGVLAQRLARRLCEACRTSRLLSESEVNELATEYCANSSLEPAAVEAQWRGTYGTGLRLYQSAGCGQCRATGYRGRIGLHELMIVGPEHRALINRRAPASELRAAAGRSGMRSLKQDGIEKCLAGLTDLHEVRGASN